MQRKRCEVQCFFDVFAGELELFGEAFFAGGVFFAAGAGFEAGMGCDFAAAFPSGEAEALVVAAGAASPFPFFFPGTGCWAP